MGFWALSPTDAIISAAGSEVADTVIIILHPEWNLIGGPISSLPTSVINPYIIPPVFGYNADLGEYIIADEITTGLGYWVFARDTVEIRLP